MRMLAAVPAIFMIALSVGILVGTAGLRYWDGTTPGSGFLPTWLAGAGILLSLLLLLALRRGTDAGSLDLPDRAGAQRVALALAGMAVYALAMPAVGALPMLALFLAFMLLVVLRQRLVPSLATTAIVVLVLDLVFVRWLAVPLPAPFGI